MSNPDIPAPYGPGRGSSYPPRPGSPDGNGRGSGRPAGGGRHGGHSNRSSRGSQRGGGSPRRGGPAAADGTRGGVREDFYSPRQGGAPDQDGPRQPGSREGSASPWGERSARSRTASRLGTGVRDIRDDLRERLRRNGVEGDWDDQGGRRSRRRAGNGGGDWGGPDDPGGKEPRRKGSWWRHWTWKKALTIVAGVIGLFIIMIMVGVAYAYSKTPIPDVQSAVMQQASKVYFSDGKTEVGQFGTDQPGDPHLQPVPRGAPRRGGGGRGQELLARGRHLAHRYPPRRLLRPHQFRREPAGRLHHHPAAGQELLRRHRHVADREPQDQGDLRLAEARPGQVQGVDPPAVPEHGLLRRWRLRCRRGGTGLFRPGPQPSQQDHPGAGRDDRRDDPEPELLQARPEGRPGPHGPGVPLEVRAPDHGDHGHAVPAGLLGGAAEVPRHRAAGEQHLERLPRVHHAGRAERAGDHLPLLAGPDQHRRPARGHHVQPEPDGFAVRHGPAGRQPDETLHAARPAVCGGARDLYGAETLGPHRSGAGAGEDRCHPGHVQRAELQQEPVRQRAAVPQPGRLLVQDLRPGHRRQAGDERPDFHPGRRLAAVDPA